MARRSSSHLPAAWLALLLPGCTGDDPSAVDPTMCHRCTPPLEEDGDDASSGGAQPAEDPCSSRAPAVETCNGECRIGTAWDVDDASTCAATEVPVCVTASDTDERDITFWRDLDGRAVFLPADDECGVAGAPQWARCDGGDDDPAACACFCVEGVCPGEQDVAALRECGFPTPCPGIDLEYLGTMVGPVANEDCLLAVLRDRTPAALEVWIRHGPAGDSVQLFMAGGAEVWRADSTSEDLSDCPRDNTEWFPTQRCTLREPSFFSACADGQGARECLMPDAWFETCVEMAPSCD